MRKMRTYFYTLLALASYILLVSQSAVADPVPEMAIAGNNGNVENITKNAEDLFADNTGSMTSNEIAYLNKSIAEFYYDDGRIDEAITLFDKTANYIQTTNPAIAIEIYNRMAEIKIGAATVNNTIPVEVAAYLGQSIRLIVDEFGENSRVLIEPLQTLINRNLTEEFFQRYEGSRNSKWYRDIRATGGIQEKITELENLGEQCRDKAEEDYREVEVLFGVNREIKTKSILSKNVFSKKRGNLKYGRACLRFPRSIGNIHRAPIIEVLSKPQLRGEIVRRNEAQKITILVHGFKTSFTKSLKDAAKLKMDIGAEQNVIVYSWPSNGNLWSYHKDRSEIIRPRAQNLADFINIFTQELGANNVNVIAHSMGNEFLLPALEIITKNVPAENQKTLLNQVIFFAPDVDKEHFEAVIKGIENKQVLAKNMTLYVSSKDLALRASKAINKNNPRAGWLDSTDQPLVIEGIDTVDTTNISNSSMGHSDVFSQEGLPDLKQVLVDNVRADDRDCLVKNDHGHYTFERECP